MKKAKQNGFTLIELLFVISIISVIIPVIFPSFAKAWEKAKEAEVKSNLHTIQIAVERYNVDHHECPAYLLGGDRDGWLIWHDTWDEASPNPDNPANMWVHDPLIESNYLASYPMNPFVDDSIGEAIIRATSFIPDAGEGDGDPRFGYKGNIMGCGLDDPNYFEDAHPNLPYSRIETKRTLDRGCYDPTAFGFPNKNSPFSFNHGLYYNFGGRYNQHTGKDAIIFWPGNFFYQGVVKVPTMRGGYSLPYPNTCYQGIVSGYMLGVWGSERSEGMDVIRLQEYSPDHEQQQIYWRMPPPWSGDMDYPCGYTGRIGEPLGLPAVLGGGDALKGPFWPPDRDPENLGQIIYGAPDGVNDGIIMTTQ